MKENSEVFVEYFWQNFDRQIDFKEYLSAYGKKWSSKERKKKIKRLVS